MDYAVEGFEDVFAGHPGALAAATAWASKQGFTSVAEIQEIGAEMVDAMADAAGVLPGVKALVTKRAREWEAGAPPAKAAKTEAAVPVKPEASMPHAPPAKAVKTETKPVKPEASMPPAFPAAAPPPPAEGASVIIAGQGSAHPTLFVKKKKTLAENQALLADAIADGRTALDHAIARTAPEKGHLRTCWKCKNGEDPEMAAQVDALYDMCVAWKQRLVPGWDPSQKPAAAAPKAFKADPPVLEAAKTGRASCKVCGTKIDAGEMRVGLPAFISGHKATAWIKADCFAQALSVGAAPDNRSKCKATGEKITKGDVRVLCKVGTAAELAAGKGEKSKTAYYPAAIADFLGAWAAETNTAPSGVAGYGSLSAAQRTDFAAAFGGAADSDDDDDEEDDSDPDRGTEEEKMYRNSLAHGDEV